MKPRMALFVLLALAQLGLPATMIARHHAVLADGEQFRFDTAPVDPADFFRGRYVALDFADNEVDIDPGLNLKRRDKVWVTLEKDQDGMARMVRAQRTRPASGHFFQARIRFETSSGRKASLDLPFDRFYMNETLAPRAEAAYRRTQRDESPKALALVRILDGRAVLEELLINDVPVRRYLEQETP